MNASELRVGDRVRFHPGFGKRHDGKIYRIMHIFKDRHSAWLVGKPGEVSMRALTAVTGGTDGVAAKMRGEKP